RRSKVGTGKVIECARNASLVAEPARRLVDVEARNGLIGNIRHRHRMRTCGRDLHAYAAGFRVEMWRHHRWRTAMVRRILEVVGKRQQGRLGKSTTDQLDADGKATLREASGHCNRRKSACRVR